MKQTNVKLIRPALKPGDQYPLRFGSGPGVKQGDLVTVVRVRQDRQCASGYRVFCINTVTGKGLKLDSSYLLPHPNDGTGLPRVALGEATGEIARLQATARIESKPSALQAAHDDLSGVLEDPDATNEDLRDAALRMCDAINDRASKK